MRVLIIIAVALITVGTFTFYLQASAKTISIKKLKPVVGEAWLDYEPAKINLCVNGWQSGKVYYEYVDMEDKGLGYIIKNFWIFFQGKHFRYTIKIHRGVVEKDRLGADSVRVTCDYAKERTN